jgi:hypothetical protein
MTSARGDQKPCTHPGCSGTMQYSRQPLPQASSLTTTGGEFGWVCSDVPAHFQFPSGRPAAADTPRARWADDGGATPGVPRPRAPV